MSAGCVRLVLGRLSYGSCTPAWRFTIRSERSNIVASSWQWSPFCTTSAAPEQTPEQTPEPQKKKKPGFRPPTSIFSAGRQITHEHIQLLDSTGEDMGTVHRSDALQIMKDQGLKLVLLQANRDPPVYQLMSGKQIHQEQLRLREKQTNKAAPLQMKELTFTVGIAPHDLSVKLKQVERWLEKKHQVKVTLRAAKGNAPDNLDLTLEQMVQQLEIAFGFNSKPTVTREGKVAACVLRPPSRKELTQNKKTATPSSDSNSEETHSKHDTDSTEGSLQS